MGRLAVRRKPELKFLQQAPTIIMKPEFFIYDKSDNRKYQNISLLVAWYETFNLVIEIIEFPRIFEFLNGVTSGSAINLMPVKFQMPTERRFSPTWA